MHRPIDTVLINVFVFEMLLQLFYAMQCYNAEYWSWQFAICSECDRLVCCKQVGLNFLKPVSQIN